ARRDPNGVPGGEHYYYDNGKDQTGRSGRGRTLIIRGPKNGGRSKSFSLYGPRFSSDDYASEGKLVLRTSDISPAGRVNVATAPKLKLSDAEFQKYRVDQGDLLVTRTGSLGTLAVFDDAVEAIPGAYLIQFRLRPPMITSWCVFYYLKSPAGQSQL